jgi:hypothetical protein
MRKQEKRQESSWKLVYVPEPAEPLPGVEAVRARWLGKWVLLKVTSEKWVRVKVYRVTNDGDVLIGVVREGVFLPWAAFRMEHIPLLLKPMNE